MDAYRELFLMQQTYSTLFSLSNKIQVKGDKYFEEITSRQMMAMVAIIHLSEDETTLNNIARKLGTTKQSVKQLITILENKGYVVTVPSPKDKRAVNIRITESGKDIMLKCGEKSMYFFTDLFKGFTGEEIELLWTLLKKMYDFDGEEQDGFEEEAMMEISEEQSDEQLRAYNEFVKLRNNKI